MGIIMIKITTTTYLKISWISIKETGHDSNGKIYSLTVDCDIFDSDTKENKVSSVTKVFTGLRETEISLETAYIKTMAEFSNSEFI